MLDSPGTGKPNRGGTRMSLLDHPQAQELLRQAAIPPTALAGWPQRLDQFLQRYLPCFFRREHRAMVPVVGAGRWDDEAVLDELRRHVAFAVGAADGLLILDGSGFPKSGAASCGVER